MSLDLGKAVRSASAIRFDLDLQPPGGPIQKIFPPTYPSPKDAGRNAKRPSYAIEQRMVDGEAVEAVLLDSVPSQANRLELALLSAHRKKHLPLPLIEVTIEGYGCLTDLEVPHRVYDAILIDSLLDGKLFLDSPIGSQISAATMQNATALYTYAPGALLFGAWNSHAGQRVSMARFPRALTSEIFGWPVLPGIKTASRIDPLSITKSAGDGMFAGTVTRWTFDSDQARIDPKTKKPIAKKPSEMGHGNVAPSLDRDTGGISIQHSRQNALLTLVHLRNLHFPTAQGAVIPERDDAARTVLAALALVALLEQWDQGYQLRSGCLLQPLRDPIWHICGRTATEDTIFTFTTSEAIAVLEQALNEARQYDLRWSDTPLKLVATPQLQELVRRNTALQAEELAEEEEE